jgi:hypothetical protein
MKRILCFANSRKHGDRCVAGREVLDNGQPGPWIRPVSDHSEGAVSLYEQRYDSQEGPLPAVLDVMNVPLLRAQPVDCQTENWLIDPTEWWTKDHEVSWDIAATWAHNPDVLFVNAGNTRDGENDEIPEAIAAGLPTSITLIRVPQLQIRVHRPWDSLKVRALFTYREIYYSLQVTDPVIETEFLPHGAGIYDIGPSLLCISLGLPFTKVNGDGNVYRYKLVAAVIRQPA